MQTYGDVYLSMTLHLPIKMTPVVFDLAQGWLESRHFIRPLEKLVYQTKVDSGRSAAVVPPYVPTVVTGKLCCAQYKNSCVVGVVPCAKFLLSFFTKWSMLPKAVFVS